MTHFLGNDKGQIGFVVILLFFFYYFAVILLLGAEINVFFAEGVRATPDNLPAMVHHLTTHLPASKEAIQEQAPPSHRNQEPEDILQKSEASKLENQASRAELSQEEQHAEPASSNHTQHHTQKDKRKPSSSGTSNVYIIVEALTGTALAFALQFFNIKRKK